LDGGQMDLDLGMFSHVIRGGTSVFTEVKRQGFTKDFFIGDANRKSWEFIEKCVIEHGNIPSEDYFFSKRNIRLIDPEDNLGCYLDELRQRRLWNHLTEGVQEVSEFIDGHKPDKALNHIGEIQRKAVKNRMSNIEIDSLMRQGPDVIDYYNRVKSGERGVLTPWDTMNNDTLGFWPGDFVVFVARSSVGKTWMLLQLARRAWMDGKKVLFIGTEMTKMKLALRFYAIHFGLPYNDLRCGKLGMVQEKELVGGIEKVKDLPGFDIVGDSFKADMRQIEASVEILDPDILIVDGIYLVRNKGKDQRIMVSNTADDMKRLARNRSIPVVVSCQFNREAGENDKETIVATNVGISDNITWASDVMYALWQTPEMKEDSLLGVKPLKLREGKADEFIIHWNFDDNEFGEASFKSGYNDDSFVDDGEQVAYNDGGYDDDDGQAIF
jgi:replicative DNA helicase